MTHPKGATRYECPISSCGWHYDDAGPSGAAGSTEELLSAWALRSGAVLRAHMEAHDLAEWAGEVTRLRALVPPPAPGLAAVPWRQGRRKGRNLYAATGGDWEAHPGIGSLDTAELAADAAGAHNAVLDLRWLIAAGADVQMAECRCQDGPPGVLVRLLLEEDPREDEEFHGNAAIGEGLRRAREWCEREGIRPS